MRIVCISDTHDQHDKLTLPDGDVLVHSGDFSKRGRVADVIAFNAWLGRQPHRHKVVIAGNHDFCLEREPESAALFTNATYLRDSGCVVEGLRFWGSPWQPRFFDWAFNLDRGAPLAARWALVPAGVDVLLTHGPPMGVLDRTSRGQRVGCEALAEALARIQPRLHVFGHIHEDYGRLVRDGTTFVNASTCTLEYAPTNAPIVVDLA